MTAWCGSGSPCLCTCSQSGSTWTPCGPPLRSAPPSRLCWRSCASLHTGSMAPAARPPPAAAVAAPCHLAPLPHACTPSLLPHPSSHLPQQRQPPQQQLPPQQASLPCRPRRPSCAPPRLPRTSGRHNYACQHRRRRPHVHPPPPPCEEPRRPPRRWQTAPPLLPPPPRQLQRWQRAWTPLQWLHHLPATLTSCRRHRRRSSRRRGKRRRQMPPSPCRCQPRCVPCLRRRLPPLHVHPPPCSVHFLSRLSMCERLQVLYTTPSSLQL